MIDGDGEERGEGRGGDDGEEEERRRGGRGMTKHSSLSRLSNSRTTGVQIVKIAFTRGAITLITMENCIKFVHND